MEPLKIQLVNRDFRFQEGQISLETPVSKLLHDLLLTAQFSDSMLGLKMPDCTENQYGVLKSSGRGQKTSTQEGQIFVAIL